MRVPKRRARRRPDDPRNESLESIIFSGVGKKIGESAVLLLGVAALMVSVSARAQWSSQLEAGYLYDDNFSRAQRSEDKIRESALFGRGLLTRDFALGADTDAHVGLEGRLTRYSPSTGASFAGIGLLAGARRKLGLGATAPWVALDASGGYENAREDVRDAYRYSLSATVGKRFTPALEASVGFAYDRRVQRDAAEEQVPGYGTKPFSVQGRSWFARASYALGERAALIGAAALRRGDVVSSTRRNFGIYTASNAIADDPALGPDFYAYRLSGARTASLTGGISWALDARSALEGTVTKDDTTVGGGLDYRAVIFALTYVYRR